MGEEPVRWEETRVFLEAAGDSPEIAAEISGFFVKAAVFCYMYGAISGWTALSDVEYLKAGTPTAGRLGQPVEIPPQALYARAKDVADAFLDGYVDPARLDALTVMAQAAIKGILPAARDIWGGKGGYDVKAGAFGMPRVVADAFYPAQLVGFVRPLLNEKGQVVGVSQTQIAMLKAMISDRALRPGSPALPRRGGPDGPSFF